MTLTTLQAQQQAAGAVFAEYDGLQLAAHYGDSRAEYQAALEGAAMLESSAAGCIWLRDNDRAALLHRLSTNAIDTLQPGQGTRTVLTNHNGRIIDVLHVHALPEALLVVTSPQQRSAVFNLLRKNIFFMDKVKLADAHETLGQLTFYGPHSADMVSHLTGLDGREVAALALHAVAEAQAQAATVRVARTYPLGGAGFCLYAPPEVLPTLWEQARQAGAHPLGQAVYDILRVEAGYAAYGRELSLDYIPLETGLWDAVSFRKGCYVGQEIIARMESRGRIAKQLRGLKLTTAVETPQPLQVDGKQAGTLTSLVNSPRFGTIGLAYVRTAHSEPGTHIGIAGREVTGQVVLLPFTQEAKEKDT